MDCKVGNTTISISEQDLGIIITKDGSEWRYEKEPFFVANGKDVRFSEAAHIEHTKWKTGVGEGIRSAYSGFDGINFTFETVIWSEYATGDVFFEFIPISEDNLAVEVVHWPRNIVFNDESDTMSKKWYTVLNILQGAMIPNDWPEELAKIPFDAQLCASGAYMPWFGQVRINDGYIAIVKDPWDAKLSVNHEAGKHTDVGMRWISSLGTIRYKRAVRYTFLKKCDYNTLCKVYRKYAKETGLLVTLAEKNARCAYVDKLIGSVVVHSGIKTHVSPDSYYYDKENPEKNDKLTPFAVRTVQMKRLKEIGVPKVYLHLDGWGDPGYDNKHPDYLPPCVEAGGWEGMKELSDTMKESGYMFGIHDQYRDYYLDAPTYDEEFAIKYPDGSIPAMSRWAGGKQNYLCTTQAPYYVKRNFSELFAHGIHLEASYLDVFTCNEGDECIHPWHTMSRKECFELRKACFDYLLANDILPSSEEIIDWAMPSLVFAHYAPYAFMLFSGSFGIPVPLLNLVYHDCVITPWLMDVKGRDYMLYALLNGGIPYLNTESEDINREVDRCRFVTELHKKVAKLEMIKHEFLDDAHKIERTTFADGTSVTVNFNYNTFVVS